MGRCKLYARPLPQLHFAPPCKKSFAKTLQLAKSFCNRRKTYLATKGHMYKFYAATQKNANLTKIVDCCFETLRKVNTASGGEKFDLL